MKGMPVFEEEADGNCMLMLELKEQPETAAWPNTDRPNKMRKVFGRCGAALIEHIVSGCNLEPSIADGELWFRQSLDNLAHAIGYSSKSVSRAVRLLADCDVLIVGSYGTTDPDLAKWRKMDRTKWYRVDMDALADVLANGLRLRQAAG